MKKLLKVLLFLVALSGILYLVYFLTRDLPIYDRFYTPQERSARDLKRIAHSLPNTIGDYVLQPYPKYPESLQAREGCNDERDQGAAEDSEAAVWCEREIFAHYVNPSTQQEMTVDFLSVTKDVNDLQDRSKGSFYESSVHGRKVFRFKADMDNEVLWYPVNQRNPMLERIGWYPEKTFTSISVQQTKADALPGTIDAESPVISYFLEKYPSAK